MRLLALDTSSDACSVAVAVDGEILESHVLEPREHTRILVPMIKRLLADAAVGLADFDAIVLGNGPGSFIGMRIGASVAQGLCFGAGLRIVPISSLAAVAAEVLADDRGQRVLVAQDARMSQVYSGFFSAGDDGLPFAGRAERIVGCDADFGADAPFTPAGLGWSRYPALVETNREYFDGRSGIMVPRARHLLDLGAAAFRQGRSIDAADLVPSYLRSKVAERPRAR